MTTPTIWPLVRWPAGSDEDRAPNTYASVSDPGSALVDVIGVRYLYSVQQLPESLRYQFVFTGEAYFVYEMTRPTPQAWLTASARHLPLDEVCRRLQAPAALGDGRPERPGEVLLAGDAAGGPHGEPDSRAAGVVKREDSDVRVWARIPRAGWLVLADAMDPGWKAAVDGKPATIELANGYSRADAGGPATHDVAFSYEPATFRAGAWISALALLLTGLMLFSAHLWTARR